MLAAERRTNLLLTRAASLDAGERERTLAALVKASTGLSTVISPAAFSLLHAQVDGHAGDLRRSYEEAVMARELGLPSERILRDNDNQLVFCYDKLTETLPVPERDAFAAAHAGWAKKWGWQDGRTPAWKKE
jgi:hypothetical protein